jgi:hypothetical protein
MGLLKSILLEFKKPFVIDPAINIVEYMHIKLIIIEVLEYVMSDPPNFAKIVVNVF